MESNIIIKKDISKDYSFKDSDQIGFGGYGIIFKATNNESKEITAIKRFEKSKISLEKSKTSLEKFLSEVEILKMLEHPHIIKFFDSYEDNDYYYLVMEYMQHGDLCEFVLNHHCDEKLGRKIFIQLISAIEYCHGKLVAHRDIKLENVLLKKKKDDEIEITLADFGFATRINTEYLESQFCGSQNYTPPEILYHQNYKPLVADIWSLGILLYGMLTRDFPFSDIKFFNLTLWPKFLHQNIERTSELLNKQSMDLLKKMLCPANKRITINKIKKHPWVTGLTVPTSSPSQPKLVKINYYLVNKLIFLGFTREEIIESLEQNIDNPIISIYKILSEKYNSEILSLESLLKSDPNESLISASVIKKGTTNKKSKSILKFFKNKIQKLVS